MFHVCLYYTVLSVPFSLVITCWERADLLAFLSVMCPCVFVTFPYGVSGQDRRDFLFIVNPIVGVCNCSMFCCTLLYVNSSIAIILVGRRELIALLYLSSWCLVMVEWLFLAVPRGCLQFVIVVFPDHTHLLFLIVLIPDLLCPLLYLNSKPSTFSIGNKCLIC